MRWVNLWLRKPYLSRSSLIASQKGVTPSFSYNLGAILETSLSSSSSLWQPVTSVNMRLTFLMRGSAVGVVGGARMSTGAVILLRECSSKCNCSPARRPLCLSWKIFLALASISLPYRQSSLTRIRQCAQLYRTQQAAELILDSSEQFQTILFPAYVICAPTRFSFFKSGISSLSSLQNSLCSLADRSMASSRRETQFSNRIVSIRSASEPSLFYKFSLMIFLKRQMLNCCWKDGSSLLAAENSSQAFSLFLRCSSWKKAKLILSLVHSGNFLTPALNILSTCLRTCWQLCSMLSSPLFRFFSALRGQSPQLQTSLCFSMYPMSSMQLFLSVAWLPTSCRTQPTCASNCSPLLNFRLLTKRVLTSDGVQKQTITAKKGNPLIQMTNAPSKPQGPRTCPTKSMRVVHKQQVEHTLKNLVAALEQQGCLILQHQNCQKERRNMAVTLKAVPSTGLKMKRKRRMILFKMNTTSPLEFCLAVSLPAVIRGQKRASATTHEMMTKMATKSRVIVEWKRCHPVQHQTVLKLLITHPNFASRSHYTMFISTSVIGRKRTVTKRGTT